MKPALLSVGMAGVLAIAPSVANPALAETVNAETWTSVSGARSASSRDVATTATYYALRAVTLWQYDRRPCALDADESSLRADLRVPLDRLRLCEPTLGREWKQADVGSRRYVTAIAACRGKRDGAIHGIALWGAAVGPNGQLVPARNPVFLQFRECTDWQAKRACPAGSVATGIRGYFSDATGGVRGLSLRCRPLEAVAANGTRHVG